jgi:flagellar protein FlaG
VIIQFTNNNNPAEQAVRRTSIDAPKVVVDVTGKAGQPSPEQLKKAADNISQAVQQTNQNLQFEFSMDTDTNKSVVRVVDKQTGELVRQIPSEETLEIARSIDQFQNSRLLNQKA